VARVVLIAWLLERHGVDLSGGWRHEALGMGLFALAVGLTASTDQLLAFLLSPAQQQAAAAPEAPRRPAPPAPRRRRLAWLAVAAAPAYLLLLAGHVAANGLTAGAAGDPAAAAPLQALESLGEDDLPEKEGNWRRHQFRTESRGAGNYFGEHSHAWLYRDGQRTALFSLDYPFPCWHDLTRCYTGQGWRMTDQVVAEPQGLPGGLVRVRLEKPGYRSGLLLFCQFDGAGQPLAARPGAARLSLFRHERSLRSLLPWRAEGAEGDPPAPVYQWQLMVEGHAPPSAEEGQALENWFVRAVGLIRKGR
jgi:hypothetical protein